MDELVRVDASSLSEIESFLRAELGEEVRLEGVRLAVGRAGAAISALANASAVTLGSVVCLCADRAIAVRTAPPGARALDVLGRLLVHECVHVWQHRRAGSARFLSAYCFSYLMSIKANQSLASSSRLAAYRSIPAECEAFEIEAKWAARGRPCQLLR